MIKRILLIVSLFVLVSCSRTEDQVNEIDPSAQIVSAVKIYSGGSQSIKITYRLSNVQNVQRTLIANFNYGFSGATNAEVPTVPGEAIVYDHGNSNPSANYYFIFNMNDGRQIATPIVTFYF